MTLASSLTFRENSQLSDSHSTESLSNLSGLDRFEQNRDRKTSSIAGSSETSGLPQSGPPGTSRNTSNTSDTSYLNSSSLSQDGVSPGPGTIIPMYRCCNEKGQRYENMLENENRPKLSFGAFDAHKEGCCVIPEKRAFTVPLLSQSIKETSKLPGFLSHLRINSKIFPHTWHISRNKRESTILSAGERRVKFNPLAQCRCTLSHYSTLQPSHEETENKHPCIGLFLGPENAHILCQDSVCTESDNPGHIYVLTEAGHRNYFSCSSNVLYKVLATCQKEKWLLEYFSPRLHVDVVWKVSVARHLTALKVITEHLKPYWLHSNWYKCSLNKIIDVITCHVRDVYH